LLRLRDISDELEVLSERRSELWHESPRTAEITAEIRQLSARIERLWAMYRWLRGAICHGSYERIRVRARREEELERELRRRAAS
jgi:hypothetical protein